MTVEERGLINSISSSLGVKVDLVKEILEELSRYQLIMAMRNKETNRDKFIIPFIGEIDIAYLGTKDTSKGPEAAEEHTCTLTHDFLNLYDDCKNDGTEIENLETAKLKALCKSVANLKLME